MTTDTAGPPDWPAIRTAFELGGQSVRALAKDHGLSHTAINKRAKAEGWIVPPKESFRPSQLETVSPLMRAAASDPSAIIGRGRNLVERLLDELDATTAHLGELEEAIETETAKDRDGRRRAAMYSAISLPTRSKVLVNLGTALTRLADAAPGKKEQREEAAKQASSSSRFAPPAPPKLVVDNG